MPGFTFTQPTATRVLGAVYKVINTGTYTGLYSLNQQIDIRTTATDVSGNQDTAVVSVNAQSIPLFQFGVFYEGDLEIHNGPRMDFAGWVHTNSNLYLTSDNTYFQDNVTSADSVFWRRKPGTERLNGVYINDKDGNAVTAHLRQPVGSWFDVRDQEQCLIRRPAHEQGQRRHTAQPAASARLPAHYDGGNERSGLDNAGSHERQVRVEGRPAHRGRRGQAQSCTGTVL